MSMPQLKIILMYVYKHSPNSVDPIESVEVWIETSVQQKLPSKI